MKRALRICVIATEGLAGTMLLLSFLVQLPQSIGFLLHADNTAYALGTIFGGLMMGTLGVFLVVHAVRSARPARAAWLEVAACIIALKNVETVYWQMRESHPACGWLSLQGE